MLVNADVKGLEWVTGTWFSQDKVAYDEIRSGADQHADNQEKFKLPDRVTAKRFVFRLVYGGTAYAYTVDSDFESVKGSQEFWQQAIDAFYAKYTGWASWHDDIYRFVCKHGYLLLPTGRKFIYTPNLRRGVLEYNRPDILNYPVQGTGADLVCIARKLAYDGLRKQRLKSKLVATVHDSLLTDGPKEEAYQVGRILKESIEATPKRFSEIFDVNFDLPLTGEVEIGYNYKDMQDITKELYAN